MLYTAILVACLAASPADSGAAAASAQCRTHEMLIQAGANPTAVFLEAENQAAQWLASHPGLSQRSLTIRPGRAA